MLLAAVALMLVGPSGLGGCGLGSATPARPRPCPTCLARIDQVRADTYASVAMRTYRQEVYGQANASAVHHIAALTGLTRGLSTGDYALARRALVERAARYAVRTRVVRGSRVLVDAGQGFVIAGAPRTVRGPGGGDLGEIEVSLQEVTGFIKLIHRLTGTDLVVRGSSGHHTASSLAAARRMALPVAGPVSIHQRNYVVSSFVRPGFGGEQLNFWILARQGA